VDPSDIPDRSKLARGIAAFLNALLQCPVVNAPLSGPENFYRGGELSVYAEQVDWCLDRLEDLQDRPVLERIWAEALSSRWKRPPVWVHGDIAWGNLVLRNGHLDAVIDFGSSAVGDPACDLVANWTLFDDQARAVFRLHYDADPDTWARARGWCIWKAMLVLAENAGDEAIQRTERAVLAAAVRDHLNWR
jgi:aminoglycoside phosphotransferase (APT) family kinase protein